MITRHHVRRGVLWTGVAIGALGVAGYILTCFVSIYHERPDRIIYIGRGSVAVQWGIWRPPVPPTAGAVAPAPIVPAWHTERPGTRGWRWLPRCTDPKDTQPGLFAVPCWIPLAIGLFALYPLLPAGAGTRAKCRCPNCRFDLTGAPPVEIRRVHVQCPECGTIAERDEPSKPA